MMSDFDILRGLMQEYISALTLRKEQDRYVDRKCSKARLRRLRLEISAIMCKIENQCGSYCRKTAEREDWE